MVSRRFPPTQSRPAVDRQAMLRRAMQAAQSRTRTAAPTRGASPIASRVSSLRGGPAGGQAPGQGAIDFGRAMTGQNSGLQAAMDAIRSRVGQQLASKGIYQDQGGYHIQGLQQPPDIGIAMRDAAVQAMGGDPWTKIVQEADARLRAGNLPIPTTAGVNGPVPSPGLGGVPTVSGGTSRTVTPPTVSTPATRGGVPQPGLGGIPPVRPAAPAPSSGGVPQPGLGGVPQVPSRPINVTPFPPQGQGVGRTTTPTGSQASPSTYPQTAPQPGLGGTLGTPGMPDYTGTITPYVGPPIKIVKNGVEQPLPPRSAPGGVPQPGLGGVPQPYSMQSYAPISPSGTGGTQGINPNASQQGRIGMGTGGQVIGSGIGNRPQNSATVSIPGRVNPQSGVPSPGLGGVPAAAGRPSTPTVSPGSLPGQSTPSRPGQMPTTFPNGKPFGTPGSPFMPNFPSAQMPGGMDLSGLGSQIQQTVAGRLAGIRQQTPLASQQGTGMDALTGLGDRIRASVGRATSGTSGMPGVGTSDLGGGLGSSIMDRVRAQLQQGGLGQPMPRPGVPTGQPTGQPTIGTTPGGAPPGSAPIVAGPGSGTSAAPTGGIGAPSGTINGAAANNGVPWSNVNQYDDLFVKWGNAEGVDPAILKSIMVVESGGANPAPSAGQPGSIGSMQIKPEYWSDTAANLGVDLNTTEGQIAVAAAILGGKSGHGSYGTWEANFRTLYFPSDDPTTGITQDSYVQSINTTTQQIHNAQNSAAPTTGGTTPTTPTQQIDPATGAPINATVVTGANGGVVTGPHPGTGSDANAPSDPMHVIANPGPVSTNGQSIVDLAQQGVGIGYGGIPDPSTPLNQITSWDCSGMTRWVTHNLGYNNVPMGSEGQYELANEQGILKTDLSQIQPGDLVFMDTSYRDGGLCGGANANPGAVCPSGFGNGQCLSCASHVGIYEGNGKILAANTNGTNDELTLNSYPVLGYASPGDYQHQDTYTATGQPVTY